MHFSQLKTLAIPRSVTGCPQSSPVCVLDNTLRDQRIDTSHKGLCNAVAFVVGRYVESGAENDRVRFYIEEMKTVSEALEGVDLSQIRVGNICQKLIGYIKRLWFMCDQVERLRSDSKQRGA